MNGVFADILKACSNWFLYIFIEENAPLNSAIMKKRQMQISWLKMLDAINPVYSYANLYNIVYDGIVQKYGKKPSEVLTLLYQTANNVSIGQTTLERETEKAKENLKKMSLETLQDTGEKKEENIWDSINRVVSYVEEILKVIGLKEKTTAIKPTPTDWYPRQSTTSNTIKTILPYGIAVGLILFLNSSSTEKRKKNNSIY